MYEARTLGSMSACVRACVFVCVQYDHTDLNLSQSQRSKLYLTRAVYCLLVAFVQHILMPTKNGGQIDLRAGRCDHPSKLHTNRALARVYV